MYIRESDVPCSAIVDSIFGFNKMEIKKTFPDVEKNFLKWYIYNDKKPAG